MAHIVLVSGSPTEKSKSTLLLDLLRQQIESTGLTTLTICPRELPASELLLARYDSAVFEPAKKEIAQALGVVVATPVYKASYSGLLKAFLDILPQYAFRGKTLLPIASGGSPGHLLAIDYAIKPLLSTMAATDIQQGVYSTDAHFSPDDKGGFVIAPEIVQRLNDAADQLVTSVKARIAHGR